jgi:hypothetical protein
MHRRAYLASISAAVAGVTAGCAGSRSPVDRRRRPDSGRAAPTSAPARGTVARPVDHVGDVDLPLDDSQLVRGAGTDDIPAIVEPAFDSDWRAVDASLAPGEQIIGVEAGGDARAYPLMVLNYHEVVNDTFGGPLLVTYCPLCGSGVVADRTVDGTETVFGVSGLLWRSDLVLYDRLTESLWSQILATAVQGPSTGTELALRPSTMTSWAAWRETHPDTEVLLPPPRSGTLGEPVDRTVYPGPIRDYDRNPYGDYPESDAVGIGFNESVDDRLHPKTTVLGVSDGSVARAYPLPAVRAAGGLVTDTVGDLPVVVATVPTDSLVGYVRAVAGDVLRFERADGRLVGGGSTWRLVDGVALDGPHEGTRLRQASGRSPMFWFAWADFHPDSEIYR